MDVAFESISDLIAPFRILYASTLQGRVANLKLNLLDGSNLFDLRGMVNRPCDAMDSERIQKTLSKGSAGFFDHLARLATPSPPELKSRCCA
jgi:hypothetical protein